MIKITPRTAKVLGLGGLVALQHFYLENVTYYVRS